jgi:hypothetical protein
VVVVIAFVLLVSCGNKGGIRISRNDSKNPEGAVENGDHSILNEISRHYLRGEYEQARSLGDEAFASEGGTDFDIILYYTAMANYKLGNVDKAITFAKCIVDRYNSSSIAPLAQELLRRCATIKVSR